MFPRDVSGGAEQVPVEAYCFPARFVRLVSCRRSDPPLHRLSTAAGFPDAHDARMTRTDSESDNRVTPDVPPDSPW